MRASLIAAGALTAGEFMPMNVDAESKSIFPFHPPLGKGQGINPGRFVWMHDPDVVSWNGLDYWWNLENFDAARILSMIRGGIMRLTGENSPEKAWNELFARRNKANGNKGGYKAG